ncbi:MAG: hypothetical protein ACK58L_20965 [Planctomycetota bacterium]
MNSSAQGLLPRLETEHIRSLLVHVDAEEISLRNAMKLLEDLPIHAATSSQYRELRTRIDQSLNHIALLAQNRQKVLRALAQRTGISAEDISFSMLIARASPAAATLLVPARQRLQKLVCQLRVLTNSAMWIIGESQRVQFTILESLTGQVSSDRYDASGNRQLNADAFRFESRS